MFTLVVQVNQFLLVLELDTLSVQFNQCLQVLNFSLGLCCTISFVSFEDILVNQFLFNLRLDTSIVLANQVLLF